MQQLGYGYSVYFYLERKINLFLFVRNLRYPWYLRVLISLLFSQAVVAKILIPSILSFRSLSITVPHLSTVTVVVNITAHQRKVSSTLMQFCIPDCLFPFSTVATNQNENAFEN